MADIPDDDINLDGFFEKADEVAKLSPQEQEAWLRLVAELGQGEPGLEDTIQKLREYLAAARREHEAQEALYRSDIRLAHSTEQLETMLSARLEGLLDGSLALPEDPGQRIRCVLYLAVMGHLLPGLRERLTQDDAHLPEEKQGGRGSPRSPAALLRGIEGVVRGWLGYPPCPCARPRPSCT